MAAGLEPKPKKKEDTTKKIVDSFKRGNANHNSGQQA